VSPNGDPPATPGVDAPADDNTVFERLPVPVLELSADGHASRVNAAFLNFAKLRHDAAAGTGWWAAVPPDSRQALRAALALEHAFHLPMRLLRGDGSKAWVSIDAVWRAESARYTAVVIDVTDSRLRELAAIAESDRFRLLADNVPVSIAYYERAGNTCRYANRRYAETFGLDEKTILGRTVSQIIGDEAARVIQPQVDHVLEQREAARYERKLSAADGAPRFIEVHLLPHMGVSGDAIGAFVLIADITRHRLAEISIRESEERLAKFMQASVEGIVFHKDGVITDANPPLLQMLGYDAADVIGHSNLEFIAPDYRARVSQVVAEGAEISYDSALVHRDGTVIPVEFIVRTMVYQSERLRMTIVRDIRDRLAAQARIHYLAHHDALTGLPNRSAFLERVEIAIARAEGAGRTLAMLFVDIDHFKRVNDSLGHPAGDTLLQVLAQRITGTLRSTDLVGRFAGDEFVVLLGGEQSEDDIRAVAHKLLAAIEAPTESDGPSISVTPSIGVALYPRDAQTPGDLIKNADTAMYHAKAHGRAQCVFFEPSMARAAYDALVLESELALGLRESQFVLFFQPQVRLSDGALVGVEALLRWQHPERGLISPDAFLQVAEERRLMLGIGRWVLTEGLRHAKRWQRLGKAPVRVGINLSTMQFQATGFVELVEQVLLDGGVDGDGLELELTERMLMDDLPQVRRTLNRLRARGIRIAVDDFGTGYTSLAHLKNLPIDRLKIDRSFIQDLPGDEGAAAVAHAIVRMASGLRLGVVAEGVENLAQLEWLAAHGCDEVQGHLIAAPMPADECERWLARPWQRPGLRVSPATEAP
jgi:diguanylate cyclase (GGDEF)-like protein/PAS domain S-box-containing protein